MSACSRKFSISTDAEHANKFTLNDEKAEFMLIGSRSRLASVDNSPILKLGQKHIRHVHYKKSLGIVLDEQLK